MERIRCPECNSPLPFVTRWQMSGFLRWRRVRACPNCGTPLRWSAAAYLVNAGSLAAVVAYLGWHRADLFGIFAGVSAIGVALLRAHRADAGNAA